GAVPSPLGNRNDLSGIESHAGSGRWPALSDARRHSLRSGWPSALVLGGALAHGGSRRASGAGRPPALEFQGSLARIGGSARPCAAGRASAGAPRAVATLAGAHRPSPGTPSSRPPLSSTSRYPAQKQGQRPFPESEQNQLKRT